MKFVQYYINVSGFCDVAATYFGPGTVETIQCHLKAVESEARSRISQIISCLLIRLYQSFHVMLDI